jgi:rare lipoprotein A
MRVLDLHHRRGRLSVLAPRRRARGRYAAGAALLAALALAAACTSTRPQPPQPLERGVASWYGGKFHGRRTASGEVFDTHRLTAAHRTLPFGTLVEVRNLDNDRTVRVRITDRGPFVRGRVIDLSYAAAREIGMVGPGTARVELALVADADGAAAALHARPFYTVQLGAFVEPERAAALSSELAAGYPAVAVRSDGTWHRVQVGEFAHRRAAERLRRELAGLGFTALVVTVR